MKKLTIAALVGGLILFIWQFLSWALLNLHASEYQYTGHQDEILEFLSDKLTQGDYFLPTVPPGSSNEAEQELMRQHEGKPWAQIKYRSSMSTAMGMNMVRSFIANVLAVLVLSWFLLKIRDNNLKTTVLISIAVGAIGYLTIHYSSSIWFENDTVAHLVDSLVQWGLCGTWLGWWLNRA